MHKRHNPVLWSGCNKIQQFIIFNMCKYCVRVYVCKNENDFYIRQRRMTVQHGDQETVHQDDATAQSKSSFSSSSSSSKRRNGLNFGPVICPLSVITDNAE